MINSNFRATCTKNDFHRSNETPIRGSIYLYEGHNWSIRHLEGLVSLLVRAMKKYSSDYETQQPAYFISCHLRGSWPLKIVVADRRESGARYLVETYQGHSRASPFIFWPFDESDMPDIPRWNSRVTMPSAWPTCVFNRVRVCARFRAHLCTYFIQGAQQKANIPIFWRVKPLNGNFTFAYEMLRLMGTWSFTLHPASRRSFQRIFYRFFFRIFSKICNRNWPRRKHIDTFCNTLKVYFNFKRCETLKYF